MATAFSDGPAGPVEPFFATLLARDASGGSWLPALLAATPHGRHSLGELVDRPGWLETPLAVRTATGRLGCFEYAVAPSRRLLAWYVDHPDRLTRADGARPVSPETAVLHRTLFEDDPPGSRERAQDRAHEQLRRSSPLAAAWWRFEDVTALDCVLITNRLVVTIEARGAQPPGPATPWFPRRSRLVSVIEAARRLAEGKAWASLLISDGPLPQGDDVSVADAVAAGTPHLDDGERTELREAYLGNVTWDEARAALPDGVGSSLGS